MEVLKLKLAIAGVFGDTVRASVISNVVPGLST
jgi:hypothetical protein